MEEPTVIALLERADQDITLAINALNSPVTDFIWQGFSNKIVWLPLYIVIIAGLIYHLGWRKAILVLISCVLTIVACDQVANLFKYGFARLRPCWDTYMTSFESFHLLEGKGSKYGFFSAHSANALGFAICLSKWLKNYKPKGYKLANRVIVIWAILVGVSRIFVGKHFLGDVLVGFAVGALIGWAMAGLTMIIGKRLSSR